MACMKEVEDTVEAEVDDVDVEDTDSGGVSDFDFVGQDYPI